MTKYKITVEKRGLGTPSKKVKEIELDSESDDFKEKIENWFGEGSFDFVKRKLEQNGSYGEAVGQHLAGHIERINKKKLDKEVC